MEYIERYLYRVGGMLPKEDRVEVTDELRELLEEEVNALQGNNISKKDLEANQIKVLKNFGSPQSVAIKYGGGIKPLIPAELMPSFIVVLKILGVVYLILFILIAFLKGGVNVDYFTSFISTALSNFGILVLIFFLIGRKNKASEYGSSWSPKELDPIPGKEKVNQIELIISVAVDSFLLIFLTLFPQYIGILVQHDGVWQFWPVEFNFLRTFLPFISIWLILRIFTDVFVLQKERWTKPILFVDVFTNVFGILLIVAIYNYGIEVNIGGDIVPALSNLLTRVSTFVVFAVVLGLAIGIIKRLRTLYLLRNIPD